MIDYSQHVRHAAIEKPSYRRGWWPEICSFPELVAPARIQWWWHCIVCWKCCNHNNNRGDRASKEGRIGERVEKCAIKLLGFSFIYFFLSSLGGSFKIGFDNEIDNSNHPCTCTLEWCAYHGVEEHSASPRNKLSRVAKLWGRGGIITSRRTTSYSSDIQALKWDEAGISLKDSTLIQSKFYKMMNKSQVCMCTMLLSNYMMVCFKERGRNSKSLIYCGKFYNTQFECSP